MRASISEVQDFLRCPQLWYYRHILRRGSAGRSANLDIGSLWHAYAAARMLHRPIGEYEPYVATMLASSEEAVDEWARLVPLAESWEPPVAWEVKQVEHPLEARLGQHTLLGTPDIVVGWNAGDWSAQWKTCANTQDVDKLAQKVRISFHESGYEYLLRENGFNPKGTLLGVVKKLSQKGITEGRQALSFHWLARSPELMDKRLRDLEDILDRMQAVTEEFGQAHIATTEWPGSPQRNAEQCIQFNMTCSYFDACYNGMDVRQAPFIQLEDRYPANVATITNTGAGGGGGSDVTPDA